MGTALDDLVDSVYVLSLAFTAFSYPINYAREAVEVFRWSQIVAAVLLILRGIWYLASPQLIWASMGVFGGLADLADYLPLSVLKIWHRGRGHGTGAGSTRKERAADK